MRAAHEWAQFDGGSIRFPCLEVQSGLFSGSKCPVQCPHRFQEARVPRQSKTLTEYSASKGADSQSEQHQNHSLPINCPREQRQQLLSRVQRNPQLGKVARPAQELLDVVAWDEILRSFSKESHNKCGHGHKHHASHAEKRFVIKSSRLKHLGTSTSVLPRTANDQRRLRRHNICACEHEISAKFPHIAQD